uniref:Sarcalumenin n=1 Tax=Strigamia maritima TaxID=126957 RepID=T1INK2_STRMM
MASLAVNGCQTNRLPLFLTCLILWICTGLILTEETENGKKEAKSEEPLVFSQRSRDHIATTLRLDNDGDASDHNFLTGTLKKLSSIYNNAIKPIETVYKFNDMNKNIVNGEVEPMTNTSTLTPTDLNPDGEIFAMPRILFVGPWSTGKSSMINYILGIESTPMALASGAQPTTSDFTVLRYGEDYKTIEGMVLAVDGSYSSLEKFGQAFIERFQGVRMPNKLLERVTIIDTPGIIENRKQQERGYPFNDVCKWFIERADLIFVVFDPTKLDVGIELETLFNQLKTHEAKVRIILNKADSVTPQELMRVYGALFWSLAPFINVTEPPRIYTGTFWSREFKTAVNSDLFLAEEVSLFNDLYDVIANRLENKIALIRQHAILVRNHALVVDRYIAALKEHKSIFRDNREIVEDILVNPSKYRIYESVLTHGHVSRHDLVAPDIYKSFFNIHLIDSFQPLASQCGFFSKCLLDKIDNAINVDLPQLLNDVKKTYETCSIEGGTTVCSNVRHEKNKYKKP